MRLLKWLKWPLVIVLWGLSMVYAFGLGGLAGLYSPAMVERPMQLAWPVALVLTGSGGEYYPCDEPDTTICGFQDTAGRTPVDCADYQGESSAVILAFGQSNSANAGRDRYIPLGDVANFNIHDGKCYRAEDPLLGPDGEGGAVWGVLADKLIASTDYQRVLLVPFGIGGTNLGRWTPGGDLHPRVQDAARKSLTAGITPTHVVWHQGESDAGKGTSSDDYFAMFKNLLDALRSYGIDAPVYPAIATHCGISGESNPETQHAQQRVRAAQRRLPELPGVQPGPDTDAIKGKLYRHDNCHFNQKGMQAHADLWLAALSASNQN